MAGYSTVDKPLEWFHANEENYRGHSEHQVELLRNSLRTFGVFKNVVAQPDGTVLAGHGLITAALAEGLKSLPVHIFEGSEAEARALMVADNELSRPGLVEDSPDQLSQLLSSLQADGLMEVTGHDEESLQALLETVAAQAPPTGYVPQEDEGPGEPPAEPVTKLGDVWVMGEHRLVCGDATDTATVEKLFGTEKAALFATDPPYGVAYGDETGVGNKFGTIANDENNGPRLQAFLEEVFATWLPCLKDNAAWYLWHAQMTQGFFAAAAAAAAAAVIIHRQIIWVKPSLVLGHGDYHWQHELCFYGWREGHRPEWYGDRCQTTIWPMGRENDGIHPTQKPVEAFAKPMKFNTKPKEICAEPFCGSGTQIIAAEQMGRRCFATELMPGYCDASALRWQKLTGKSAILESTGETFDALQQQK